MSLPLSEYRWTDGRDLVCFASSFAYESAPNITHMTLDGKRTACGSTDWITSEGWHSMGPCCLKCRRAWDKLPESERQEFCRPVGVEP